MKVTSTEFQQNVGRYQDAALVEPVVITKNGRDKNVLISAAMFETITKGRVSRRVEDLDSETLKVLAASEVPAEFAYLDKLKLDN
ncbi:MAG: type II toxin-antitoxin system prevent-host-death family antitoxin [Hyphomicrobiales bacterium]|nr:type II toxin-antitoxin system prevent-host-death family antitoxin [Hyphomicrobiales bacterium]